MKKKIFITSAAVALATSISFAQPPNLSDSGNALDFNNSTDVVDFPNTIQIVPAGSTQLTLHLWVKGRTAAIGIWSIMISEPRICGNEYFAIAKRNDERIAFSVATKGYADGKSTTWTTTAAVDLTEFHQISCTWDGTNGSIYIDGIVQPVTIVSYGGGVAGSAFNYSGGSLGMAIGNYHSPSCNNYAPGQPDEVRIWNIALTQTEIRNTMCQKLVGNEPGLVGYWRFDETSGTTAYDSSGNGNDGILK